MPGYRVSLYAERFPPCPSDRTHTAQAVQAYSVVPEVEEEEVGVLVESEKVPEQPRVAGQGAEGLPLAQVGAP